MANDLLSYDAILRDAMDIFSNNCVAAKCVNRRYQKEAQNAKRGDSFYVPLPETPTVSDGPVLDLKDIAPEKVLVTLDKHKHCAFQLTAAERTHSAYPEFAETVLRPRMEALANQVDIDLLNLVTSTSMSVGTPGTGPTNVTVPLQAAQKLTEHGVPMDDRHWILSPAAKVALVGSMPNIAATTPTQHGTAYMDGQESAWRKGLVGTIAGFDTYESPNVYTHTVGADVTMANYSSGGTEGSTSIVASAAGTLAIGDIFTIAGVYDVNPVTKATLPNLKQFVVTAASSASTTINFAPAMYASGFAKNVSALPTATPAITFVGTASTAYSQSVAFHRDAYGLVSADMELPNGVHESARRTHKGISASIITDFDSVNYRYFTRIDILYGVVAYRPHTHAVRVTS